MPEFRKKPVVVEATQWFKNGDHPEDQCDPAGPESEGKVVRYFRRPDVDDETLCERCGKAMRDHGWIDTLEGGHIVCPSDWIITGTKGERYPCKDDIFRDIYEPADAGGDSGWNHEGLPPMTVDEDAAYLVYLADTSQRYTVIMADSRRQRWWLSPNTFTSSIDDLNILAWRRIEPPIIEEED